MIRVLIVDDHPAVRAGLEALLRREPGFVPIASTSDSAGAVGALGSGRIDLALVDYHLGVEDGLTVTQALRTREDGPAVIVYSGLVEAHLEVAGRLAGAAAVLTKGAPADELFDVMRRVARGETVRPAEPARLLATAGAAFEDTDRPILALLLDGSHPSEAAETLGMSATELEGRTAGMLRRLRERHDREGVAGLRPVGDPYLTLSRE